MVTNAKPGFFEGRGCFLNRQKKGPAGKIFWFFSPRYSEDYIQNEKFKPQMETIRLIFSCNSPKRACKASPFSQLCAWVTLMTFKKEIYTLRNLSLSLFLSCSYFWTNFSLNVLTKFFLIKRVQQLLSLLFCLNHFQPFFSSVLQQLFVPLNSSQKCRFSHDFRRRHFGAWLLAEVKDIFNKDVRNFSWCQ